MITYRDPDIIAASDPTLKDSHWRDKVGRTEKKKKTKVMELKERNETEA